MDSTVKEGSDKTACLPCQPRGSARFTFSGDRHCQDMMIPAEPASTRSSLEPLADQLRLAVPPTSPASRVHAVSTPNRTCAAASSGAPSATSIPWPPSDSTWRCTSGGCRKPAGSSPQPSPAGPRSQPGSTAPAPSTAFWSIHAPSTSAVPRCLPNRRLWASPTCSSRLCSPPPASHRTHATSRWWRCSACGSSKPPARTSPT